jgi:hypothetical protein
VALLGSAREGFAFRVVATDTELPGLIVALFDGEDLWVLVMAIGAVHVGLLFRVELVIIRITEVPRRGRGRWLLYFFVAGGAVINQALGWDDVEVIVAAGAQVHAGEGELLRVSFVAAIALFGGQIMLLVLLVIKDEIFDELVVGALRVGVDTADHE